MHKPFIVLFGLLLGGIGHAAELAVVQYVSDPVALLDETGRLLRKQPRTELPATPLAALQWNEDLELVQVEIDGQRVWSDGGDVRLRGGKGVTIACARLPRGKAESASHLCTSGYGAGCADP